MSQVDNKSLFRHAQVIDGHASMICSSLREVDEARIVLVAFARSGRNPQAHGIVHEIIFCNHLNRAPQFIVKRMRAKLSLSPIDPKVDVYVNKGEAVLRQFQLKDTPKSVDALIRRIKSGAYDEVEIFVSNETMEEIAKRTTDETILSKVKCSGISNEETKRIAGKYLGQFPSVEALVRLTAKAAFVGAVVGAGVEAAGSYKKFHRGDISSREYVVRIAEEGVGGAVTGAGCTVIGSLATAGAAMIVCETAPVWLPLVAGIGTSIAAGTAIKVGYDKLRIWVKKTVNERKQAKATSNQALATE